MSVSHVEGFFGADEKVLLLTDLTVAQFFEYSEAIELYMSKWDWAVCGPHLY